jgi:hypothetical protein
MVYLCLSLLAAVSIPYRYKQNLSVDEVALLSLLHIIVMIRGKSPIDDAMSDFTIA